MIYKLEPKTDALKYILGEIDQLDVSYTLQSQSKTSYNNLLLCFNNSLLDILYKYDQYSPNFEVDQTDTGQNECLSMELEFVSDNLIKLNIVQKFVRCFAYYKEPMNLNTNVLSNSIDFVSLYPKLFLDSESTELDSILTAQEKTQLLASNVMSVEYNTDGGHQEPTLNYTASKSTKVPEAVEFLSFVDTNVNYPRKPYTLTDGFTGMEHDVNIWYDDKPGEDKYSSQAKTFNIINDSTIIMEFEMYINMKQFKYLLDTNDVNINYHINVASSNNVVDTGTFDLDLYESVGDTFSVNDIVYIKNIFTDAVIAVCKVMNVTDNTLSLMRMYANSGSAITIDEMDMYILNKVKNLENFNDVQVNNNLLRKMTANNMFVINDIEFTEDDYLALNNLG